MHAAFTDFTKSCKLKVDLEPEVMAGFAEAFAAVDKLMTEKPNVYPPAPPKMGTANDAARCRSRTSRRGVVRR